MGAVTVQSYPILCHWVRSTPRSKSNENNGCRIFHFDRTLYWIPTCLQIAHNIFTCLLDCAMERWEVVDTKVIASKVHRLDHCDTIRSRSELSRAQQSWQPSKMLFKTKYYLQQFIGIKQKTTMYQTQTEDTSTQNRRLVYVFICLWIERASKSPTFSKVAFRAASCPAQHHTSESARAYQLGLGLRQLL